MDWPKTLYEVLGSQYPRLSILIAALVGAIVFGGGWWLIGKQYERGRAETLRAGAVGTATAEPGAATMAGPTLSPVQERLLELLAGYQKQFGVGKLVISRKHGTLHFDNEPQKGAGVSLIRDLYGSDVSDNAVRFEQLVEGMPADYLRFYGEARFDNPFVVSITEAGMRYLRVRK